VYIGHTGGLINEISLYLCNFSTASMDVHGVFAYMYVIVVN